MTAIQAIALGLIQGLTEFLPVSSSGHLLLGSFVLGLPAPGVSLSLLLHLGTALATVVMLWREIAWLLTGLFAPRVRSERGRVFAIIGMLAVASVPGAVAGLFFGDFIDRVFASGGVAALGLIITGFVLWSTRRPSARSDFRRGTDSRRGAESRWQTESRRGTESSGRVEPRREAEPRQRPESARRSAGETGRSTSRRHRDAAESGILGTVNLVRALIVGVAQGVAVIPGISRSGATITSGLLSGMGREDAARFSFLLALPAVFGGALLDYRKVAAAGESVFTGMALLGASVAFLAGMFALSAVFRVVRKGEISKFAYYCWATGGLSLIWLLVRA